MSYKKSINNRNHTFCEAHGFLSGHVFTEIFQNRCETSQLGTEIFFEQIHHNLTNFVPPT